MKRLLASALVLAIALLGVPSASFAAGKQVQPQNGQVSGTARNQAGQPVADHGVQLRNTVSGQVALTSTTNGAGAFSFTNVAPGTYVVELVDNSGQVIAVSSSVTLSTGSMTITGVAITTTASNGAAAAAAAGGGSFFTSTPGIVLIAAAAGGGVVALVKDKDKKPKSPNK